MLPYTRKRILYAVLLTLMSIGTSAVAKNKIDTLFDTISFNDSKLEETTVSSRKKLVSIANKAKAIETSPMFNTVILGADEEVVCSDNGFTIARFNLCGDADDRTISLAGGPYASIEWQQLGGTCTPDTNSDCPNPTLACYTTVSTSDTFDIVASTISDTSGAEFRVVVDGQQYFFKVRKNTIPQTYVKRDFICGLDGRIQITNLSSIYEYSIDGGASWQNSAIFNGLAPGTYTIITRLENIPNACEYVYDPIVIEQLDISIDVEFFDAQCFSDTGSITVTVNDVPGPFKYTLLDENGIPQEFTTFITANPYTFSAVGFGTYSIQVETQECAGDPGNGLPPPRQNLDINGNPISIGQGIVPLSASTEVNESLSVDPSCNPPGGVDIILRTSGGTAPYTYTVNGVASGSFSPPETTYNVTNAGTYNFMITDANGCSIDAAANVVELIPPEVTASGIDGNCTNGGAKININVVDGRGYNLSFRATPTDPWSTDPLLAVAPNTYSSIQVRYEQGSFDCILTIPTSITVNTVGTLNGNIVKIADVTCDGNGGTVGGILEFQGPFSGGSGSGYVFSISGDNPTNFTTQTTYNNLPAGVYTPIIRDDSGCRLELAPITIVDVDPPTALVFDQTDINCAAGTTDVALTATSTNPIVRYEIISPTLIDNGANNTFNDINVNTSYEFRITDNQGCIYSENFTPVVIGSIRARIKSGGDLNVCTGATDGDGTFIIDGFANNYTFNIDGGTESAPQSDLEVNLNNLAAGDYIITVTDVDTGCQASATLTIQEPTTPLDLTGDVTAMSCLNNNNGRIIANATGGFASYNYSLTYPLGTVVGPQAGTTFGGLTETGNYTLNVDDAEGCTATFTFSLNALDPPVIDFDATTSNLCFEPISGASLGVQITTDSTLGAPYEYRINGGAWQLSPVFSGLSPGNYEIEVRDDSSCGDTINLTINPQLRAIPILVAEIPCGGADGTIQVQVNGGYITGVGTEQYEISSDNGATFGAPIALTGTNFTFDTNTPGTYVFRVTDNEGCVAESNPVVLEPPVNINPASAEVFTPVCGETNSGRAIIIPDATSGVAPYEINFDGNGFSSQTIFSNLNQGQTYSYVIRDANGCLTLPQDLTIPNSGTPPDATISGVDAVCNMISNIIGGQIDVTAVAGGVPNFTYVLEDQFGVEIDRIGPTPNTTVSFTNVPVGSYTVFTIDRNACVDEDQIVINDADLDVIPDALPAPVCSPAGFTNTVTIVGGVGPFDIRLVTDPPSAFVDVNLPPDRHTFNGLQFGVSYTVEVFDEGTGCTHIEIIDPIDSPSPLDVTATSSPGFCDLSRNGQIEYTVTGFTPGDDLLIEVFNVDTGSLLTTENPTNVTTITYMNIFESLPGNYQILVTNLTNDCNDATLVTIARNLPSVFVLVEEPANCNASGQLTVVGSGGAGGPYEFAFGPAGFNPTGLFSNETTFTGAAGNYDIYVRDVAGCTSFDIGTIIQQEFTPVLNTPIVNNQCDITATAFQITVSTPNTTNTPRFTINGTTQLGNLNGTVYEATFIVNTPGNYNVLLEDANGCSSMGIAEVFEFLSASGGFSTIPTCNDADGIITITTNGGSGNFNYELRDGAGTPTGNLTGENTGVFTGVAPGDYEVLVTDDIVNDGSIFCPFLVDGITLEPATIPVIESINKADITCNGDDNGSIDVILQAGTDIDVLLTYTLYETGTSTIVQQNGSGSFAGLSPAEYDLEVMTSRNCFIFQNNIEIIEPSLFEITASASDFTCVPGANTFSSTIITATITSPGTATGGYQYSITGFENYQSNNTFEIIDNGLPQDITVYAIDGNGCETSFNVPTINPPSDVIPSFSVENVLDCANPERLRIDVIGTTDFTIVTNSHITVGDVNVTGASFGFVDLPAAGDYLIQIIDNIGGCTFPLQKHEVATPILPTVVITEANPITCAVPGNDGELSITVTDYIGNYAFEVFAIDNLGNETSTGVTGNLNTSNNPETISGLEGGNFVVRVTSTDTPFCENTSNLTTIRTPNGPLVPDAIEIGNVSCTDNTGEIQTSLTGGWDVAPYEYRLLRDIDGDLTVYEDEIEPWGNTSNFQNLSSGDYRVEYRDIENCTTFFDIRLDTIPPIQAGIREPQGLVCPDGNNAVLEAFDPTTGDAITAIPGATGGVLNAGYIYQLIYYAETDQSADPTTLTEVSRSGLQDSPTFIGSNGTGFIPVGWYAIEISSGFECVGVTTPYFVNPPPAIIPSLVQIRAPGCGGLGQMRLSVENPEPGFEYEYRFTQAAGGTPTDQFIRIEDDFGNPSTATIIENISGFYQFEVRKINATNTCGVVNSNGLNMVDAQDLDLVVNQPDDITCSSETDGRIESFSTGGVGSNTYTLYIGNPVDAFNPSAAATVVATNDFGTFEQLSQATDYYIAVTSGATCQEIEGPYAVIRPEQIVIQSSVTPVSCNGERDGSIRLEVVSGGEGILRFAIGPNFSGFFNDPNTPNAYTFENLEGDVDGIEYTVLIQDERGCLESTVVVVYEPEVLEVSSVETPEICLGFSDATAQLTITGGTPFVDSMGRIYYETSLDSDDSIDFVRNDSLLFENLTGGETYDVFVRDANGCIASVIVPIEIGVNITAESIVDYGCEGIFPNSTARVEIEDETILPEVLFALDVDDVSIASTTRIWGDLPAGNHTVYIYHPNGCTTTTEFTIEEYKPLILEVQKTGETEITAIATGGFGGYEFFFQGESTGAENVFNIAFDATVFVTVIDQQGCIAEQAFLFDFDGVVDLPDFFTPDGDGLNDVWSPDNREFFPNIDIIIYDRYGRVVARLNQVEDWDGTYSGKPLPTGDYWYVVNANDNEKQIYVGHLTLLR